MVAAASIAFAPLADSTPSPNTRLTPGAPKLRRRLTTPCLIIYYLGGHFGPPKKYLAPPPKNPQFAADTLLTPWPLLETPPPLEFSIKNLHPPPPPPLPAASDSPFPLPEQKKIKNIRNVCQAILQLFRHFQLYWGSTHTLLHTKVLWMVRDISCDVCLDPHCKYRFGREESLRQDG